MEDKSRYYAIAPRAVELLLEHEHFTSKIWDCGCGEEFIPKILGAHGYEVITGPCPNDVLLGVDMNAFSGDVIANPPYSRAFEYCQKALGAVQEKSKVALFLKLTFLEGQGRNELLKAEPPKTVYVFPSRVRFAKTEEYKITAAQTSVALAWFVWIKGFHGDPVIKWIE